MEISDGGELRLEKIYRLIGESTHSIHDISRVELDGDSGLPRFNMPIELGIALGYRRYSRRKQPPRLLILDSESFRYQKYASDLAGLDIAAHASRPEQAIACVRHFLSSDNDDLPTEDIICQLYQAFELSLPSMAAQRKQAPDKLNFRDRLRLAEQFLLENRNA